MVIIRNETTLTFEMNGVDRPKNYVALLQGDNIVIMSAYDSNFVLLKSTPYTDFTIQGNTYSSAQEVVDALTPVIYTKQILSPGGAPKSTSNTLQFHNSTEGVNHAQTGGLPLTGDLVIDPSNKVEGGFVTFPWSGDANPNITGVPANLIQNVGLTISAQGTYEFHLWYSNGTYKVNITQPVQYVGAGGGDTTAPLVQSATVENAAPTNLVVVFDEPVVITNLTGLSLDGDWSAININSFSGSGTNTLTFVLDTDIANGESGNFVYNGNNTISDSNSNDLVSGTTAITNNVAAGVTNRKLVADTGLGQEALHDNNADTTSNTNRVKFTFIPTDAPTTDGCAFIGYGRESTFAECKVGFKGGSGDNSLAMYCGTGSNHGSVPWQNAWIGQVIVCEYIVGSDTVTITVGGVGQTVTRSGGVLANVQGSSVIACYAIVSSTAVLGIDRAEIEVNGSLAHTYELNEADTEAVSSDTTGTKDMTLNIGSGNLAQMRADV